MYFGSLPPEVNSGLMYSGAGAAPMLAAASAWDSLAAELHAAAAGYNSVITGLASEGWMGPASTAMAAAAAPYAAWMSATAAQVEQTAAQARGSVTAYEAAFAATVPPPVVAANRAALATLVATNVLGQNTPAIAANEALYAEMWAQDATAMDGYFHVSATTSALSPFSRPKQMTNPNGASNQAASIAQSAGNSASTHASSLPGSSSYVPPSVESVQAAPLPDISGAKDAAGWATLVPQNGSYIFSLANAMAGLSRAFGSGGGAAVGAAAAANAASGMAAAAPVSLASFTGAGSALTAGLGQSGSIGALSVPQAWAAASPLAGSAQATLASATMGMNPAAAAGNPSMLGGLPMLANAMRGADAHNAAMPRFDLRPSVIPISPAAG